MTKHISPHSRRHFLASIAATSAAAIQLDSTPAASRPGPRKKLIGWGSDVAYPSKIQNNIRKIEDTLPFDGIILSNFRGKQDGKDFTFDWECFGRRKFDRRQIKEVVSIVKNIKFKRFTDNFLRFNVQPGNFDWFDDFSAPVHNAKMFAKVARDVGVKGWKFDVEDYKDKLFVHKKQKHAGTKSFNEYAKQVRERGRQIMEAIQSSNPSIVLLLSLAHSYVNRQPNAHRRLDKLESYGMLPAFVNGLLDVAGPRVRLIDGQEQAYGYLTSEDYYRGYHDAKQRALELVPRKLWPKYRSKMEVGVAVFANYQLSVPRSKAQGRHWPATYLKPEQRLQLFEQNIYNSLSSSDEYVWLYSELMGWCESGYPLPTPNGALDAIKRAKKKHDANQPLGFDLRAEVDAAKKKMKAAVQ